MLDIDTIVDNSRAISEGVNLESVTRSFLTSAIENAGAQRGVLLLVDGTEVTVGAESKFTGEFRLVGKPLEDYHRVAHSIVHFVANKGEAVILEEASKHGLFTQDPWVTREKARSVLALPAHHRGELRAILFLTNELASGVFTKDRLRLLDLLCAQAAISIGQAKVYEELEQRVESRTCLLYTSPSPRDS